jgi:signal transduction histidine kinase
MGLARPNEWSDISLRALIEAVSGRVALLDPETRVVALNAEWQDLRITNSDPFSEMAIGVDYLSLCRRIERDVQGVCGVSAGVTAVSSGAVARFSQHYSLRVDDQERHYMVTAARPPQRPEFIVVAHVDLTEALASIPANSDAAGLKLAIEEAERKRIARELHDDTLQQVSSMRLALETLGGKLGNGKVEDVRCELAASLEAVQDRIRTLTYVLHPPEIRGRGLTAALQTFVAGFARRTGLDVRFRAGGGLANCARHVEGALYRVAQEALNNAHRHAIASHVVVRLKWGSSRVTLEIEDDGVGIPEDVAAERTPEALGVGLSSMRERLAELAGRLEIRKKGPGTLVRAIVPLACPAR